MYRIRFFTHVSTRKYKEDYAKWLIEKLKKKYGSKNVKLVKVKHGKR